MDDNEFPAMNPPSEQCGGFIPDRDWVLEQLREAVRAFEGSPSYATRSRVRVWRDHLNLYPIEADLVQ